MWEGVREEGSEGVSWGWVFERGSECDGGRMGVSVSVHVMDGGVSLLSFLPEAEAGVGR